MARPKEFDRDAALLRAIDVFADYGYGGTSTDTLRHAMGIGRQSLYDTFGTKQALYIEALKCYNRDRSERIVSDLNEGATPIDGLARALLSFIDGQLTGPNPACLGIGAICEFGARDPDVMAAGTESGAIIAPSLLEAVEKAKAAGEIDQCVDPATAVQLFMCILAGLKVLARSGAPADSLRNVGLLAMKALR